MKFMYLGPIWQIDFYLASIHFDLTRSLKFLST
jgi:hypothetical protein